MHTKLATTKKRGLPEEKRKVEICESAKNKFIYFQIKFESI